MTIQEITSEQFDIILKDSKNESNIGLFFISPKNPHDPYVGIDNSTGDCWTEDFQDFKGCIKWLLDDQCEFLIIKNQLEIKYLVGDHCYGQAY